MRAVFVEGAPDESARLAKRVGGILIPLFLALGAFAGVILEARMPGGDRAYVFEDLTGPREASIIADEVPTSWRQFEVGGASRLAILLSEPDSAWLGLVHGLRSIGPPFVVTDDYERALRHRVVLVYPVISGRSLAPEALRALAGFVHAGGTLVGVNVVGGGLEPLFGFSGVAERRDHTRVRLDLSQTISAAFDDPREAQIRIAAVGSPATRLGTHDYLHPVEPPLAVYEDGKAAIVWRVFESGGRACAFGFDPGLLLLKAHNRRLEGVSDRYANAYDPSVDIPLRLLAALYRTGEPMAVMLEPVRDGRRLALMVTHDVDYSRSIGNSITYATYEREAGFAATYFVQTKYVRDWNDEIFLDETGARHLERLTALGMDIASHSVAHAMVFDTFPLGSGRETYPEYRPFVKSRELAYGDAALQCAGPYRRSARLDAVAPLHSGTAVDPDLGAAHRRVQVVREAVCGAGEDDPVPHAPPERLDELIASRAGVNRCSPGLRATGWPLRSGSLRLRPASP